MKRQPFGVRYASASRGKMCADFPWAVNLASCFIGLLKDVEKYHGGHLKVFRTDIAPLQIPKGTTVGDMIMIHKMDVGHITAFATQVIEEIVATVTDCIEKKDTTKLEQFTKALKLVWNYKEENVDWLRIFILTRYGQFKDDRQVKFETLSKFKTAAKRDGKFILPEDRILRRTIKEMGFKIRADKRGRPKISTSKLPSQITKRNRQ
jgi:hypothetical protein